MKMNIEKDNIKYGRRSAVHEANPKVAILILNWNDWEDTINCLESVRKLEYSNFLTVVVDNGSQDGSIEKIRAWISAHFKCPFMYVEYEQKLALQGGNRASESNLHGVPSSKRIVLIRNKDNLGYDGGNNVGIHYALKSPHPADYVFILNSDAIAKKDCLGFMVDILQSQNAGIVGAVIVNKESQRIQFARSDSFFRQLITLKYTDRLPKENKGRIFWHSPIVCGAAILIRNDVLRTIYQMRREYFNSELFAYHDELDFCYIASKIGYKAVVAGASIVYHRNRERASYQYRSRLFHYYFTRNAILLANRLLPPHQKILFHVFYFPINIRRAAKMILCHKKAVARTILAGMFDGYRGIKGKWKLHDSKV